MQKQDSLVDKWPHARHSPMCKLWLLVSPCACVCARWKITAIREGVPSITFHKSQNYEVMRSSLRRKRKHWMFPHSNPRCVRPNTEIRAQQIFYTPTAQKLANRIKDLFTGGAFTKNLRIRTHCITKRYAPQSSQEMLSEGGIDSQGETVTTENKNQTSSE